ncbi:hypothetical protein A0J61_01763 [Choanephora cucurbitarum]|uniref:Enoyl reductase (ER) domain-containing protein n=1 Tax=Choanephora cucurbitarum TaxID=101091 RepID=A0A1C7NM74_9FUNG|nr:hypothetical protein A0J61_01763 [Choanephora cucurbitarum]
MSQTMHSLPKTQTVYRIVEPIGLEGLKKTEEPLSSDIGNNEVLVKIKSVSLNFRDLLILNGKYSFGIKKSVVPCSDGAGEVVAVGRDVRGLQVGDRVTSNFGLDHLYGPLTNFEATLGGGTDGTLCQYKVFPQEGLNKLPKDSHLTDDEAASLVCTGATAWNALYGSGRPFIAGQSVLVLGTGGLSITTMILAKAAGAIVIVTSSSDEKLKYVKETYGADHTINYKTHPDWEKEVLKATNGEGVDIILETGGNGTIIQSLTCAKVGGQVNIIGMFTQPEKNPSLVELILGKALTVRGILVGSKQQFSELSRFVHAKKLRMPIEKVFGFSEQEVNAAFAKLESQTHIGKTIIRVD